MIRRTQTAARTDRSRIDCALIVVGAAALCSPTAAQSSAPVTPHRPEAALAHADRVAVAQSLSRHTFVEVHFGNIPVELTIFAGDVEQAREAATAAFARVRELGAMMDDYAVDPPSALNQIAAAAPAPIEVPVELFTALEHAVRLHDVTAGAFDITAKPYVQLWRVSQRVGVLPPGDRLRRAATFVDINALQLDRDARTARLTREGMWLDLGGLAKGQIGDEVVRLLRQHDLPICRYHAGGDMVFGDAPPGLPGWPVHVPDFRLTPDDGPDDTLTFWESNAATSVSGDVFRFVEIDGKRYAHVIDPRTGLGVTDRRIACVRGPRGIDTDPLATAGLILDETTWQAAISRITGCSGHVTRVQQSPPPVADRIAR